MNPSTKFPWISLVLLLLAYFTFGWSYGKWADWTIEEIKQWYWFDNMHFDAATIDIVGGFLLVAIVFVFTGVITLLTEKIVNWVKTQLQIFTSIIGGSLAVVFVLCLFEYFIRFLVLLAAAALFRIELRNANLTKKQAATTLAFFCLTGFVAGVVGFTFWGRNPTGVRSIVGNLLQLRSIG